MENRIAIIGIIVENMESVEKINGILHENNQYIAGRMGIPYKERSISVISVVVDALPGVSCKTVYSKTPTN